MSLLEKFFEHFNGNYVTTIVRRNLRHGTRYPDASRWLRNTDLMYYDLDWRYKLYRILRAIFLLPQGVYWLNQSDAKT